MRSYLSSLGVAGVVAACLVSGSALANSAGINGRSGKQGQATTCMAAGCHSGSTNAPTVTLEGPSSLAPGATGNYRLIVRGGPGAVAGFNVAVDGGGTLNSGSGSYKLGGELTHTGPRAFSSGQVAFDFTLVAPASDSTLTLFGAGNSSNNNSLETGDASALASPLTITVGAGGGNGGGGDDEDSGGCAAAGGAPLLGAVLMVLGARLRRRR